MKEHCPRCGRELKLPCELEEGHCAVCLQEQDDQEWAEDMAMLRKGKSRLLEVR